MAITGWRNRIVRSAEVAPDQLLANKANWRIHPRNQQDLMGKVLDDVGWVARVMVQDGTDLVIDGHMRVAIAISKGEATIPVDYVDLSDEECNKILATFDPLGAMAVRDEEIMQELLADMAEEDEQFFALMATFEDKSPRQQTRDEERGGVAVAARDEDDEEKPTSTSTVQFVPAQHIIVITCTDETHQSELLERFLEEGLEVRALVS